MSPSSNQPSAAHLISSIGMPGATLTKEEDPPKKDSAGLLEFRKLDAAFLNLPSRRHLKGDRTPLIIKDYSSVIKIKSF